MSRIRVGLLGVGTVGSGVARMLTKGREALKKRSGVDVELISACDLDPERTRELSAKGVSVEKSAEELVTRDDVDVLVELIGGLEPARTLCLKAIETGKSVVTANKAMLASFGPEIAAAAKRRGVGLGFEASVCGGVPVILALRSGLVANRILSLRGIVNGTCNYILTKMTAERVPYESALAEAQALGYAEGDPAFDVEGTDSAHKLAILAGLAFGAQAAPDSIHCEGISGIDVADIRYALEMGYVVKLLAVAKRTGDAAELTELPQLTELRVHPALLPREHPLAAVSGPFNAVELTGDAVGTVILYGRGAGSMPTASAVVADIVELARGSARGPGLDFWDESKTLPVCEPGSRSTRFYVRFWVRDEFGVLGKVARVLGEHRVSIASVMQKELPGPAGPEEGVNVVMLTHEAKEADFRAALSEIDRLDFVTRPSIFLRIEGS